MLGKIAWKSIIHKPLNTALCVSLLLFGVGIISLLLLIQHQLEQKFTRDLRNIDMVVGAKGSPLQLVLSAVYHLDAPNGNIPLAEAQKIMNNPMVAEAIPLAYGDSYRGYRILGTSVAYPEKYSAQLAEGKMFAKPMEVTLGAELAAKFRLRLGDTFLGTHGEVKEGHVHDDYAYTVVGILEVSNSVVDRLILTNVESVWLVHSDHGEEHDHDTEHAHEEGHDHGAEHEHEAEHDHKEGHDHDTEHDHGEEHQHEIDLLPDETQLLAKQAPHVEEIDHKYDTDEAIDGEKEITAVLLKYKSKMAVLNMPRIINEQTNMQAVLPGLEVNRLFNMIGIGATTLRLIAAGIMLMAGFSVFFVLYNRLRERKYELALMRSVGYRPGHLFALLVLEGLLLAVLAYVLGWLVSRLGIYVINQQAERDFNLHFGADWVPGEELLLIMTIVVGLVSALLPAWRAMRMDVAAILSESRT